MEIMFDPVLQSFYIVVRIFVYKKNLKILLLGFSILLTL